MKEKKIKDPVRVTVILERDHHSHIKKQLLYQSNQEGFHITLSEGMRRAAELCFPMPEQLDFTKRKKC